MPGLVRKLVILAAVDGLILQPLAPWNTRGAPTVHIAYGTHIVRSLSQNEASQALSSGNGNSDGTKDTGGLEAHGIVGLLQIASSAYLIAISRREHVAQLWNKPVYGITDVSLIPVSSRQDAESAIVRATKMAAGDNISDDESDQGQVAHLDEDWLDDLVLHGHQKQSDRSRSRRGSMKEPSVAADVIGRKGAYGRFSGGWFSRTGWMSGQRKNMGLTGQDELLKPGEPQTPASTASIPGLSPARPQSITERLSLDSFTRPSLAAHKDGDNFDAIQGRKIVALIPKLVQTAKLLLDSKTFFYAYDHDITRRMSDQAKSTTDAPLYRRVETQYFWNQHLASPFVEAGLDEYVLPIMQGFVGQRSFSVKGVSSVPDDTRVKTIDNTGDNDVEKQARGNDFLVTLISRRSIRRNGLRYLRRGIDEQGHVANAVETEQILSSPWDITCPAQSFVQVRGSIPLFFTQTPYNLKPVPLLHGSAEANARAIRSHFEALSKRYGTVKAVSLINQHGNEAKIGSAYQTAVEALNEAGGVASEKVGFEWFDFHQVCKGMKFENVSQLLDSSRPFLDRMGWSTMPLVPDTLPKIQRGIMRINCMDCLDRTNVVQSSFAEYVLSKQLSETLGTAVDLRSDPSTTWLATLWADNGDAVSLAYTSTAALKGDYVRTRRRNVFGLLTDLSLTLSRYYHNLFEDFFVQSALDYMLGNVNAAVFGDLEAGVRGADLSVDVNRMRREAIDACSHHLLRDQTSGEEILGGWALAAPVQGRSGTESPSLISGYGGANMVMNEAIFLLTDKSVAHVNYDWEAERVTNVQRVPLERVTSLQWGTWICDTLSPLQMDEARNVGFIVVFDQAEVDKGAIVDGAPPLPSVGTLAFKALPTRSAVVRPEQQDTAKLGERQLVQHICEEVARAITDESQARKDTESYRPVQIVEKDIVSLEEARQNTGYIDQLGYSIRKLVWG